MKVTINRERCSGHLRCMEAAPEIFDADDFGDGQVVGDGIVPAGMEADVELAVDNCPERAITIEN